MLLVYVITDVPADTPVTTPVELTVATDVVADTHGFDAAAVPEPVKVVDDPAHTIAVPEMVTAAGCVMLTLMLLIFPVFDFTYMV